MMRITTLRNLILKAKHAYYYSGEPIMSDSEYDALEDELRILAQDDPVLAIVGAQVPADSMLTKARHSIPMGSQSKVNSEAEFRTWFAKSEIAELHASLKGDGASAAAYYSNGRLVQAISRGDGTVGEDITANALRFKGLPAWVGDNSGVFSGAVRFEVILTVDDWTRIDPSRSKNPRNAGAGIMGRKNGHQSDFLTIFAFDLDETREGRSVPFRNEMDKSVRLAELGFSVIPHRLCANADEAVAYFQSIANMRDSLPFWIDGVVLKIDDIAKQIELGVTSGRPKGQMAWKFDSVGVETVLEGVVVSGGHTGGLYPTAQLHPVEIGGTTVSNASLANYDEIARLDVAVGDSVWVVKANDIIPKIIRVTHRPETRMPIPVPNQCPFCGGEVGRRQTSGGGEGVIIECRNSECSIKSSGKIRRWIASLDILGIGDAVREAMIERFALEDAADLYLLRDRAAELADLVINTEKDLTLGEKRTTAILDAIDVTRTLTLGRFLGSLGIDHLGKRRVELMINAAGGDLDTLDDWRSGRLREPALAERAGVPNVSGQIQDAIDKMSQVIDKLLANGVTVLPPVGDIPASDGMPLKTVCISGKLPSGKKKADYAEPLNAAGYGLVDDVTKGLDYLVLADPNSSSSKAEKARKLGIEVISEERLEQMVIAAAPAMTVPSPPPTTLKPATKPEEPKMTTKAPAAPAEGNFQRYEYVDDKSSKFWEIKIEGAGVEVRYGKIGTIGQSLTKDFDDGAAARKHADKLTAEKLKGGYQPANSSVGSAPKNEAIEKANAPAKPATEPEAATPVKVGPKAQAPSAEKSVCISGKLPSGKRKGDYAESLAAIGYHLVEDVKPGLTYLVLADPTSASAKAEKATKLGIQILSEEQLVGLFSAFSSASKGVVKPATEVKDGNVQQKQGSIKLSKRDIAIQRKMAEGLQLKSEILSMLDADPEFDKEGIFPSHSTPAEVARKRLHFLTETFKPKTRVTAFESANRMASMFPGPFFCSTKYPQPKAKSGTSFFPILQVDLDWLESLTGKQFGRGLMQLWFDYEDKFSEYIRVIPPHDLNSAELIPFDFNGLREAMAESYLFSEEWQFLDEMKCHEISALHSEGLTCPKLLLPLEEILGDITEVESPLHKALLEKVADLESLLSEDWGTHFFGSFSPIQMSVEDFFPSLCFMSIEQWGSGNAQIFYAPDGQSEAMRFSFSHCARG